MAAHRPDSPETPDNPDNPDTILDALQLPYGKALSLFPEYLTTNSHSLTIIVLRIVYIRLWHRGDLGLRLKYKVVRGRISCHHSSKGEIFYGNPFF